MYEDDDRLSQVNRHFLENLDGINSRVTSFSLVSTSQGQVVVDGKAIKNSFHDIKWLACPKSKFRLMKRKLLWKLNIYDTISLLIPDTREQRLLTSRIVMD